MNSNLTNVRTTKHHQYLNMAHNQSFKFSVVFYLFSQMVLLPNNIDGHIFNIPNAIDTILSHSNWTENHECVIELNAIKDGIESNEEWVTNCKYLPMQCVMK